MGKMIKPTKLTDEELQKIKSLQEEFQLVTFQLGELHIIEFNLSNQLKEINKEITNFRSTYTSLQEKEKELLAELKSTYPDVNINFETGELS